MTPLGLLAMRKAAALAFAVPGMEVDIAHGDRLVCRVERRVDGHVDAGVPAGVATLLSPCAFRSAVGRAHVHARNGGTALFLGLGADADPTLAYHMPFTGAVRPLGLIVSRLNATVVHVFATECHVDHVREAIAAFTAHPALPADATIAASFDPVTAITLVYSEVRVGMLTLARPLIESSMEALMLRFGTDEVTRAVAAQSSRTLG